MYITRVILKNIRCFKQIDLDFRSDDVTNTWTLVLGDNGVGKTTLLRSIAMALCDASGAAGLLQELYGEWVRSEGPDGGTAEIAVQLAPDRHLAATHTVKITIEQPSAGEPRVTQEIEPASAADTIWDNIFVCGYGSARRAYGTKDYSDYSVVDSVYTLFNYDSPLQNPELILRRINSKKTDQEVARLLDKICSVLCLPAGSIKLEFNGIKVSGPWGTFMPLGAIGDGYQATFAWICDMLSWAMFYDPDVDSWEDLTGIVLLDEIEQHLHPSWQKRVIGEIARQFPSLQFIATTHSPLCAIGAAELRQDDCGICLLEQKENHVEANCSYSIPRRERADQVLTSHLFGLDTTRADSVAEDIVRLSKLLSKPDPSLSEQKQIDATRQRLSQELGSEENPFTRTIVDGIRQYLATHAAEEIRKSPSEVVSFEIKRQLRDLMR